MRQLLGNVCFLLVMATVFGVIGFSLGIFCKDFAWFARFGSIITALGIVLISRPTIIGQELQITVMDENGLAYNDPEKYIKNGEPIPDHVVQDVASRKAAYIYGPLLTLAGTIIWGFGDLINAFHCFRP